MVTLVPNYYESFSCIADRCQHTCCQKWEIDIDPSTKRLYDSLPGQTGEKLRASIKTENGVSSFIFREDGYCPFLTENHLCGLINQYGDEILCDICADHPRFRNFFGGQTEVGIGLCCEEAARVILTGTEPFSLVTYEKDRRHRKNTEAENEILEIRSQLLALAQYRAVPVLERMKQIAALYGIRTGWNFADASAFLLTLERLDEIWTVRLNELQKAEMPLDNILPDTVAEQFLAYHLFRYLPDVMDSGNLCGHVAYCLFATELFMHLCAAEKAKAGILEDSQFIEIAREYSSEIEYSDINVGRIIREYLSAT